MSLLELITRENELVELHSSLIVGKLKFANEMERRMHTAADDQELEKLKYLYSQRSGEFDSSMYDVCQELKDVRNLILDYLKDTIKIDQEAADGYEM